MGEHNTGKGKKPGYAKYINENHDHEFEWFILSRASKNSVQWKILDLGV